MAKGSGMPRAHLGESAELETLDGTIRIRINALHAEPPPSRWTCRTHPSMVPDLTRTLTGAKNG